MEFRPNRRAMPHGRLSKQVPPPAVTVGEKLRRALSREKLRRALSRASDVEGMADSSNTAAARTSGAAEFRMGDEVVIQKFEHHASLNGKAGVVEEKTADGRFNIRCVDKTLKGLILKFVKAENIKRRSSGDPEKQQLQAKRRR